MATNPFLGLLDDEIRLTAQNAIEAMVEDLGKECVLYYPPEWVVCSNCVYDPIGKKSASIYLHGGPIPFQNGGICPVCGGSGGFKADQRTETIKGKIQVLNFTNSRTLGVDFLRMPAGSIYMKTYIWNIPKIINAEKMSINPSVVGAYGRFEYKLYGQPVDKGNIVQGRYCVSIWERIGS